MLKLLLLSLLKASPDRRPETFLNRVWYYFQKDFEFLLENVTDMKYILNSQSDGGKINTNVFIFN